MEKGGTPSESGAGVFLPLLFVPQISCPNLSWKLLFVSLTLTPTHPHHHHHHHRQRQPSQQTVMAQDELEYLKSLVSQLNEKIHALEQKAKAAIAPKTPAQQLRTILVGPPGAGTSLTLRRVPYHDLTCPASQERAHRPPRFVTSSAYATSLPATCSESK